MITIHQFKMKYFLTEADAPPAGGAPPPPPPGGDMGGLGGGPTPPPPPPGGDLGGLGGGLGGAAGNPHGATTITDIKKLNAWDLLEKHFSTSKN